MCRELQREKIQARLQLLPLLLAEQDMEHVRKQAQGLAIEQAVMKDVPGWKMGERVYHTGNFVPERLFLSDLVSSAK